MEGEQQLLEDYAVEMTVRIMENVQPVTVTTEKILWSLQVLPTLKMFYPLQWYYAFYYPSLIQKLFWFSSPHDQYFFLEKSIS